MFNFKTISVGKQGKNWGKTEDNKYSYTGKLLDMSKPLKMNAYCFHIGDSKVVSGEDVAGQHQMVVCRKPRKVNE